jgi:tRNA(Ile)-lysidine synthase
VREGNNSSYYRISRELLKEPLIVRNAKPADKIHLKSMNGSKKLKNYFSEQNMPKVLQNKVIIIQNNNETMLIWGPQVVCSDKYRYNNKTKDKPLYIEVRGC